MAAIQLRRLAPVPVHAEGSHFLSSRERVPVWPKILLIFAVALMIATLDQLTKNLIQENLRLHESVPVIEGFLNFTHVLNPGAAFSLAEGATWIFSGLSLGVVVAIIWFAPRLKSVWWVAVFAMLLGGTLGNLYDRLFREPGPFIGHVVDFIHVLFFPGIFNVADIFIVSSMILFFLLTVFGVEMAGKKPENSSDRATDSGTADSGTAHTAQQGAPATGNGVKVDPGSDPDKLKDGSETQPQTAS